MSRRRGRREKKWPAAHELRFAATRQDPDFERWWEDNGFAELRQLLLWRWDPLGVADVVFPWAEDEYDMYARGIAEVLHTQGGTAAVAAHLESLELHTVNPREGADPRAGLRDAAALFVSWFGESRAYHREFGVRDRRPPDLR